MKIKMKIKGILDLWDCRGFLRSRGAAKGLFYRRGAECAEDGPGGAGPYRKKVGGERGQAGRDYERESERERKGQRRKAEIGKKLCGLCVSAVRDRGSLIWGRGQTPIEDRTTDF